MGRTLIGSAGYGPGGGPKATPEKFNIRSFMEMQEINPCDSAIARINKSVRNAGAIYFNPTKTFDYMTGKYSPYSSKNWVA